MQQFSRCVCVRLYVPQGSVLKRKHSAVLTGLLILGCSRVRASAVAEEKAPAAEVTIEKTGPAFAALKDIEAIQEVLPHRCASKACFCCRLSLRGDCCKHASAPVIYKHVLASRLAHSCLQVPVPARRQGGRTGAAKVCSGLQVRKLQRQLLHWPLPRQENHAR